MNKLNEKVRLARRRLALQRFLKLAPWCCFFALLIAAVLVGVDKYYSLGLKEWAWPAIGATAGLLTAAGLTWLHGQSVLDAAVEIDRRFGLKERVSSAYALSPEQRESPIGQALIDDAIRGVNNVEVSEQFRLSVSRWALLPVVPVAVTFLVAVFFNPSTEAPHAAAENVAARQQVKKASEVLNRQSVERNKELRDKNISPEAKELFTKLEEGSKQLIKGDDDKRQAMVKINDLTKEMEKRQQELQKDEKLKEQLEQLKNLTKGPADKLGDALRNGDVKEAAKELKALKEQLQNGKLDAEQKAQLAKQMEELEEKVKAIAEKQEKLANELKQQIAEKRAAGKGKEADELEKKLQKLEQQAPQQKKMQDMAKKLGECAQCAKNGDAKGAAEALDQLGQDMEELQAQLEESQMLNDALDQLADAKEAMACKQCNGQGCAACNGNGNGNKPGNGLGKGQGQGERPEQDGKTSTYDTKVKQQTGKGASTITDRVDGPNVKGRVEQEIQTQFESVKGASSDPLADTKLPRGYRDHARKYFDSLREGEQPASSTKSDEKTP